MRTSIYTDLQATINISSSFRFETVDVLPRLPDCRARVPHRAQLVRDPGEPYDVEGVPLVEFREDVAQRFLHLGKMWLH